MDCLLRQAELWLALIWRFWLDFWSLWVNPNSWDSGVVKQRVEPDLLENTLPREQLNQTAGRKAKHRQSAVEHFGARVESPALFAAYDSHARFKGSGIIESLFIGAPALALGFGKTTFLQAGFAIAIHDGSAMGQV